MDIVTNICFPSEEASSRECYSFKGQLFLKNVLVERVEVVTRYILSNENQFGEILLDGWKVRVYHNLVK